MNLKICTKLKLIVLKLNEGLQNTETFQAQHKLLGALLSFSVETEQLNQASMLLWVWLLSYNLIPQILYLSGPICHMLTLFKMSG